MTYKLSRAQLDSVTDAEVAFGTMKLLPEVVDIPAEFWAGNLYTQIASALFYGRELPKAEMEFRAGFEDAGAAMNKAVRAHLMSREPKHEHKIAGVGYMISTVSIVTAEVQSEAG